MLWTHEPGERVIPSPSGATLVDRVDARNEPVGLIRREDVLREHANFRTVHVLLTNERGDLLLQQLAPSRERHALQWGSSVAGYLHAGESYVAAAARRTREEVDVVAPLTDWGVLSMRDEDSTKFVGVFSGRSDHPRNGEPAEIAQIEFRPVEVIERDLAAGLSTYTDTFVQVFGYWKAAQA